MQAEPAGRFHVEISVRDGIASLLMSMFWNRVGLAYVV